MCRTTLKLFIFLFLSFIFINPCSLIGSDGHERVTESKYTQEELQETYDSRPLDEKEFLDSLPANLRREALERLLEKKRKQAQQQIEREQNSYVIPLKLKEAYDSYLNEEVPRDKVIEKFETFLQENPETPFRAEIYFRIGALYSMHRRVKLEEKYDHGKMIEYFQKSHETYGEKYSQLNNTIWASLANMPESDLGFRKEYLDWLQEISNMTDDDIFPIREIEQTFNGRPPELRFEEKNSIREHFQKHQEIFFKTACLNVYYREGNNYHSLVDLMQSFPNTELSEQCDLRLKTADKFYLDSIADVPPKLSDEKNESRKVTTWPIEKEIQKIFIPNIDYAIKNKMPFIYDVNANALLKTPTVNKTEAVKILQACDGFLWSQGMMFSEPNCVISPQEESLQMSVIQDDTLGEIHKLPENILPYTFCYQSKRKDQKFEITVHGILDNGILVSLDRR